MRFNGIDEDDDTMKEKHILFLNGLICIDLNSVNDDKNDLNKVVMQLLCSCEGYIMVSIYGSISFGQRNF